MNYYQIINNENFILNNINKETQQNQNEINKKCIEKLNFTVNKSLPRILNYIDNLFQTNLNQINHIHLSFNSDLDYNNFLNKEIKKVFNLEKTFIDKTNIFSCLYNLTIKEFAILIGFNQNENLNDEYIKSNFKLLISSIKKYSKNNEIIFDDYYKSNKSKIDLNKINIEDFKSINNDLTTEDTTPINNIILSKNEKTLYDGYKKLSNENVDIFDNQPNENKLENNNNKSNTNFNNEKNSEINKKKKEIEEIIDLHLNLNKNKEENLLNMKTKRFNNNEYYENKNYQNEMYFWLEISKKKLLKKMK